MSCPEEKIDFLLKRGRMVKINKLIINKIMEPRPFAEYVDKLVVGRGIDKIIFHHTSSPIRTWHGSGSMLHYWNLYRSRGWISGPHIFIAPEAIWLFTPISEIGRGVEGHNTGAIHIEVVGRYFSAPPMDYGICFNTAIATDILMKKFKLKPHSLLNHFHYDPSNETEHINGPWVMSQIRKFKRDINQIYSENELFNDK